MVKLFEREYTRRELQSYFGTGHGVYGITRLTYDEGRRKGVQVAEFKTGSGLRFHVLLDRGLDIGLCEWAGIPISFQTSGGETHPAYYEPEGDEWMRGWGGGLVTTCGLTYLGAPDQDSGQDLGLHGRIHSIPGEEISTGTEWQGSEGLLRLTGKVRESKMLGYSVLCERTITSKIGDNRIFLNDVITNEGFQSVPHMVLYHCNFGHPLLEGGTRLLTRGTVRPRDEVAAQEGSRYNVYDDPDPNYPDTVFYHDLNPDETGFCTAALFNPRNHLGVYLRFPHKTLPRFIQWKNTHAGSYAAGLEPANCLVEGRSQERKRGTLQYLEPGESRNYSLEIGLLTTSHMQKQFMTKYFPEVRE